MQTKYSFVEEHRSDTFSRVIGSPRVKGKGSNKTRIVVVILKIAISSNLIGSINTFFLNLTAKSIFGECSITK